MRTSLTLESPADHQALRRLQPLVQRVFGGERTSAWWPRKLAREAAEPGLSVIARSATGELMGYGVAGRPYLDLSDGSPHEASTVRAVTMGVVPEARGRGLGTAIWDHLLERAASAGARAFELSAQAGSVPFYERLGFGWAGSYSTWTRDPHPSRADGSGDGPRALRFDGGGAWHMPGTVVAEWIERAWVSTPPHQRARLVTTAGATALVSREPGGLLVQRLALGAQTGDPGETGAYAAVSAVAGLAGTPEPARLFVYGVEDDAATTSGLRECLPAHGFFRAQSFFRMLCPL